MLRLLWHDHSTRSVSTRHSTRSMDASYLIHKPEGIDAAEGARLMAGEAGGGQARRGVIWRKRSFGTQSENDNRFVESILTVVITLRQQNQDVLNYLAKACKARTRGGIPPSLLPAN